MQRIVQMRHAGRVREADALRQELASHRPADATRVAKGVREIAQRVWNYADNSIGNVQGIMDGLDNDPKLREARRGGGRPAPTVGHPILHAIRAGARRLDRSKLSDHFKQTLAMLVMHDGVPRGMSLRQVSAATGINRRIFAAQLKSINDLGEMKLFVPSPERASRSDKLYAGIVQQVTVRSQ